jgi:hypothetical protein
VQRPSVLRSEGDLKRPLDTIISSASGSHGKQFSNAFENNGMFSQRANVRLQFLQSKQYSNIDTLFATIKQSKLTGRKQPTDQHLDTVLRSPLKK